MSTPESYAANPEHTPGPTTPEPSLSSLPVRIVEVFFSPGKLTKSLAARPAWGAALGLGVVLAILPAVLIPVEVWQEMFREQMLSRGQDPSAMPGGATMIRIIGIAGGSIGYLIFTMLLAGLTTLIFAFVLGDEGRFKQYLAMITHAFLITGIVSLLLVPLKIAQGDPSATLNLGTFLFFLEDGYLFRWMKMVDLTAVWGSMVIAMGATAIDSKRSFGSAATILIGMFLVITALLALIPGSG